MNTNFLHINCTIFCILFLFLISFTDSYAAYSFSSSDSQESNDAQTMGVLENIYDLLGIESEDTSTIPNENTENAGTMPNNEIENIDSILNSESTENTNIIPNSDIVKSTNTNQVNTQLSTRSMGYWVGDSININGVPMPLFNPDEHVHIMLNEDGSVQYYSAQDNGFQNTNAEQDTGTWEDGEELLHIALEDSEFTFNPTTDEESMLLLDSSDENSPGIILRRASDDTSWADLIESAIEPFAELNDLTELADIVLQDEDCYERPRLNSRSGSS